MDQIPISFKLKGERTYVHGTDMYNSILTQLDQKHGSRALGALRFTIHTRAEHQGILLLGDVGETAKKPENAVAEMNVSTPEGEIRSWLTETGRPVTHRYPYDEDKILDLCQIEGTEITITGESDYTPIEIVVAMNKGLNNHLIDDANTRWLFTRLQLERPLQPGDASSLRIALVSRFAGNRLTKAAIFANRQHLGHIYFSAVKP